MNTFLSLFLGDVGGTNQYYCPLLLLLLFLLLLLSFLLLLLLMTEMMVIEVPFVFMCICVSQIICKQNLHTLTITEALGNVVLGSHRLLLFTKPINPSHAPACSFFVQCLSSFFFFYIHTSITA